MLLARLALSRVGGFVCMESGFDFLNTETQRHRGLLWERAFSWELEVRE